jgi:hypothetical protein
MRLPQIWVGEMEVFDQVIAEMQSIKEQFPRSHFFESKFIKHKNYNGPKIEWLYDCSWRSDKEKIGVQFVTEEYIRSILFGKPLTVIEINVLEKFLKKWEKNLGMHVKKSIPDAILRKLRLK